MEMMVLVECNKLVDGEQVHKGREHKDTNLREQLKRRYRLKQVLEYKYPRPSRVKARNIAQEIKEALQ